MLWEMEPIMRPREARLLCSSRIWVMSRKISSTCMSLPAAVTMGAVHTNML
ncbi:MAG: hypothetical protein H6R38_604 [Deltaproteobacteria bacterium]|nr:hypothetical protein [Deltaproteobacteria bacterium]